MRHCFRAHDSDLQSQPSPSCWWGRTVISFLVLMPFIYSCDSNPVGEDSTGPEDARVRLSVVSGSNQTGLLFTQLPDPIVIQASDHTGNPVSGERLDVRAAEGSGAPSDTTIVTDSEGRATIIWTLGGKPGDNVLHVNSHSQKDEALEISAAIPVEFQLPEEIVIWPADTLSLGRFVQDLQGRVVPREYWEEVQWSHTSLVNVVEDTVMVGVREGRDSVTVSLDRYQHVMELSVGVKITVRAESLNGHDIPENYFLYFGTGSPVDSAGVNDEGMFILRLDQEVQGEKGELWIDAGGGDDRTLFPSIGEADSAFTRELTAVMIPREWELHAGRWAGERLAISLFDGFGGEIGGVRSILRHGLGAWRLHDYPIPVWFKRLDEVPDGYEGQRELTPSDSTEIWSFIHDMHERVGHRFFEPVDPATVESDSTWTEWSSGEGEWHVFQPGTVSISALKRPNSGNPTGGVTICSDRSTDLCDRHGKQVFEALSGGINLPISQVQNSSSVQHELLHALNFGHTQFFCSVMSYHWIPTLWGGRCDWDERWWEIGIGGLTPYDVAYFWLWQEVNEMHHRSGSVDFGIVEALRGERRILMEYDDPEARPYGARRLGTFGDYPWSS